MRRIGVSVLSVMICANAFGDARLPAVNVGASGVSARAAFGDVVPVVKNESKNIGAPVPAVSAAPVAPVAAPTPEKRIVARPAVDRGQKIAASSDVLTPRRPSADLWARGSDSPLRMPTVDEFSVVRADYDLPEESLDGARTVNVAAAPRASRDVTPAAPMSEIDTQIARLVELQRRADDSVNVAPRVAAAPATAPASMAAPRASREIAPRQIVADTPRVASAPVRDVAPVKNKSDGIAISRMVVPMEEAPDVVVRAVQRASSPTIAAVREDMTSMSPSELRKAFRKTYLSENKHLSTFQIDSRFDVASDMSSGIEGFTAQHDLSEAGGVRPLEIKIRFRGDDSALSRENYNLLSEYASIVVSNPKRAIQIAIPQRATVNTDDRKLAARRLAIVEQVLRDTGVSEQRILPVLSQRDDEGFVLRIISSDQYETLTQQQKNIFGDSVSKKTYKSMAW